MICIKIICKCQYQYNRNDYAKICVSFALPEDLHLLINSYYIDN